MNVFNSSLPGNAETLPNTPIAAVSWEQWLEDMKPYAQKTLKSCLVGTPPDKETLSVAMQVFKYGYTDSLKTQRTDMSEDDRTKNLLNIVLNP